MRAAALPGYLRDTALRFFPHRTAPGLRRVGDPGPDAPLLLTCNFALTVRRVEQALAGRDVWLLVADSKGINVWCAAGGGHLTHHQVIAVLRTSGVADRVTHRRLVLPQLAATGVEGARVEAATGFRVRWGPARLEELPAYLDAGRATPAQRRMTFPAWERLEMAAMWAVPMAACAPPAVGLIAGWQAALATLAVAALAPVVLLAALPWLPVSGAGRWGTFALLAALSGGAVAGVLIAGGAGGLAAPLSAGIASAALLATLVADVAGTTPLYPSSLNTLAAGAHIELDGDRCAGDGRCLQVCPRGVFALDTPGPDRDRRRARLAAADACVACAACAVQCPEDALAFRLDDGRRVEPATLRRTRLNLLGKRSVELAQTQGPGPGEVPTGPGPAARG